ncbi:CFEM domain-containing protein [Cordyceps javanica]|uniref:CFEM domain-containing protein n=1 Tax=Cordyceps javanica TaxID=43265 RepID=A0A545UZG4_9HYPO|nr:CFEM domain-containing protein [Cordyceps javanica]TQW06729.1 CFEM domain-containing protein [Cordyceps javanica]
MSIILGVLAVFLVLVRLAFKQFWSLKRSLGPDDKIVMLTVVLRISCTVLNVKGLADHGLGKDVWTMSISDLSTFVRWLYIMEVLYLAELSLLKLSLSAFYLCVFPGTGIRRLLWGVFTLNVLFGVIFVTVAIFQCSPIHYWWTQYGETPEKGHCININAMGWSNAGASVLIDILMIAAPLSQITKLQLHWRKKIGVIIMFLTGTFVTIVSILRLRSLVGFANSRNPTWDQWEIAYWSTIEVNIGMICTCLPSLRLLLLRLFPELLGNTVASGQKSSGNELTDLEHAKGSIWQSNMIKSHDELEETGPGGKR